MAQRFFTLDEANRTLPLVRRIVTDIVDEYHRWKDHVFRYELLAAGSKAAEGETPEQVALRDRVDESARRINEFMEELAGVGCQFKGFEEGLVDFPSRLDGREILLCWKLGEDQISWWHDAETGFAGRRAIEGQDGQDGQDGQA